MPNPTDAIIAYIRALELRVSSLERLEGGGGGGGAPFPGFGDAEGDPANVGSSSADGSSLSASRRDHAHTIGAGVVTATMLADGAALAEILDDDGHGSGLDADLLDGQHAAAFSGSAHTHAYLPLAGGAMTGAIDTGSGVALELKQDGASILKSDKTTADAYLQLGNGRTVNGLAYVDLVGDATNTNYGLRLIRNDTGANAISQIAHRGTGAIAIIAVDAAAFTVATTNAVRMTIEADGDVGIGTTNPQGRLHVHDGTGGFGFFTKTGINTTAQVIIPNGAGDVVYGVYLQYVLYCSTGSVQQYTGLVPGGNLTVVLGANSFSLRCNADGSLDVRRTAGSADGILSITCVWA